MGTISTWVANVSWRIACCLLLLLALALAVSYASLGKLLFFQFIERNDIQITTSNPKDNILPSIFSASFAYSEVKDQKPSLGPASYKYIQNPHLIPCYVHPLLLHKKLESSTTPIYYPKTSLQPIENSQSERETHTLFKARHKPPRRSYSIFI